MFPAGKKLAAIVLSLFVGVSGAWAADIGTAFTYQGSLENGSGPVTDTCDFRIGLWDADAGGNEKGASPQAKLGVGVVAGVFTIPDLDFGAAAIDGTARWLAIEVQCPGDAGFTLLSPRVALTPAPHALALPGLYTQENATSPNVIGGYSGNVVASGIHGATIAGGGQASSMNQVTADYGTVSGGDSNTAGGLRSAVGGGNGNAAGGPNATIAGGRFNTADGVRSTIGGGLQNTADGSNSTIGGGANNAASGNQSTVGGGAGNTAGEADSTVGGGGGNTADGESSTVSGGEGNTASNFASTVGGGWLNTTDGDLSTVGGGQSNTASGFYSTVPGGFFNAAGGDYSFAAGRRAKANHSGSLVWGDSTDADFTSTGSNQFLIRAAGGVGIGKNNPTEQLDVQGNIRASGTIQSGSSITINGASGVERISSTASLDFHTAAGRALRLENNSTSPNVVGGFSGNQVTSGAFGGTIGGGGHSGANNRVTDNYGTVGGGDNNRAGNDAGTTADRPYATVGGGFSNTATGNSSTVGGGFNNTATQDSATVGGGESNTASKLRSTIGGGWINTAGGESSTVGGGNQNTASGNVSTVGGGNQNTASGDVSTVGGGFNNTASGNDSTVPGGAFNTAGGDFSFAAGYRAKANHQGAFVWGDSTDADVTSSANNQFTARASGGVRFFSNSGATIGVELASGGGSWSVISDRNVKRNIEPIDPRAVLERLAAVPIATWNYVSQDESIRHIGPMAQDFHAAFTVGEDERYITSIDADGVALAAIQGLHEIAQEKDCRIAELEAHNHKLEARLTAIEQLLKTNGGGQ